jgi:hypothetical protein
VGVGGKGEIVTETVSMNVDEDEEPAMVETPGAKLQKLREELQLQMAQKRLELWKQKHEQGECLTIEKKDNGDCQKEKDILDDDDEEEFEITDSEEMDEDEDEEDDSLQLEKPKVKSAFINEEVRYEYYTEMIRNIFILCRLMKMKTQMMSLMKKLLTMLLIVMKVTVVRETLKKYKKVKK